MITIATLPSSTDAHLLQHQLEATGINSFILDAVAGSLIGGGQALGSVRIQVADEDADAAKEVVEEYFLNLRSIEPSQE